MLLQKFNNLKMCQAKTFYVTAQPSEYFGECTAHDQLADGNFSSFRRQNFSLYVKIVTPMMHVPIVIILNYFLQRFHPHQFYRAPIPQRRV